MTDTIFPFEVQRSPRTKQCRPLPSKRYCFFTSKQLVWVS